MSFREEKMDSNDMYRNNQTAGTEPDNNQTPSNDYSQGGYSQDAYNQSSYNQNSYQQGNYDQNAYQQGNYDQNTYQQGNYGQNAYQQGNYGQNTYQQGNYGQNAYQQYPYNSYNGNYQAPQLDLEEPVKMGEWLISFLIMMVPCVNIVMMFVWAFSKTEKKSKSNFFKAYLVMLGIVLALYFVAIIFIVALGFSADWYY